MNESIELLQIYMKILYECESVDVKEISARLKPVVKTKQFLRNITIEHKTHNESSIRLRHCDYFHCIECLQKELASGLCNHEKKLTAYEKSLLGYLEKLFPLVETHEFKYKKCLVCHQTFDAVILSQSSCNCYVCEACILERYKNRELKCFQCSEEVSYNRVKKIAKELNQKVHRYQKCKGCELNFEYKALTNEKCLGCREA